MKVRYVSMGEQQRAQRPPQPVIGSRVVVLAILWASLLSGAAVPALAGERPVAVMEVRLFEHRIEMLAAAPPGPTNFEVTNAGTTEHNFEVESKDLEKKFELNLKPGETKSLQLDLTPGKYTVYCPVDNHKALGMQLELTVAEQRTDESALPPSAPARRSAVVPHTLASD
jgi:plastocyanin